MRHEAFSLYFYDVNFSLLAVNYFEQGKDKHNLMKSYYYAAVTWDDIGDSPRAQDFFKNVGHCKRDE